MNKMRLIDEFIKKKVTKKKKIPKFTVGDTVKIRSRKELTENKDIYPYVVDDMFEYAEETTVIWGKIKDDDVRGKYLYRLEIDRGTHAWEIRFLKEDDKNFEDAFQKFIKSK